MKQKNFLFDLNTPSLPGKSWWLYHCLYFLPHHVVIAPPYFYHCPFFLYILYVFHTYVFFCLVFFWWKNQILYHWSETWTQEQFAELQGQVYSALCELVDTGHCCYVTFANSFLFCTSPESKSNTAVLKPRIEAGVVILWSSFKTRAASKQRQLHTCASYLVHYPLVDQELSVYDTTGCSWSTLQVVTGHSVCVCVCVRPPDQCFGCHVWAAASLYNTETSCHYSLVSLSSQGSALLCLTTLIISPSHLAGLAPGFLCGLQAGPAAARRQLALRTRQTPADGGPRTRHAKYLSSRRRHMKYSSMVCIRFYSTNLLKSLLLLLSCTMSIILFIDNIAMITIFLTTSNILQGGRLDTSHNLSLFWRPQFPFHKSAESSA